MASEAAESSTCGARREAAARQQLQLPRPWPWVALSSVPVVYGDNDARLAPGVADLLLELQAPPRASYLALPERVVPDPRSCDPNNFPYIIAAVPDRVLVMATQRLGILHAGYFLCDVRAGTATRLPAVPADFPFNLFPRRAIGLIADPGRPGHHLVAQLHPSDTTQRRHDAILCYSTATGQWAVKTLASAPKHEPWGAHGVIPHHGRLWWIDIAYGMLVCDPFVDHPHLRFVPLPFGREMRGLGGGVRPSRLMDQRRFIRLSKGMLRYVEVQGLSYDRAAANDRPDNPAVSMWTLADPARQDPWNFGYELPFADIWAYGTYIAAGLPRNKVPKLALLDPDNPCVIYFFHDMSLFAVDVRAQAVVACDLCFVDRVFEDPDFQYSRFVDAWEQLPTVRGEDDPASAQGHGVSGTKGPDGEEESDATMVSDEELASLLSKMEIKSQPDREQSASELLMMIAEDQPPPSEQSEPSVEAEAGEQADEA